MGQGWDWQRESCFTNGNQQAQHWQLVGSPGSPYHFPGYPYAAVFTSYYPYVTPHLLPVCVCRRAATGSTMITGE